MDGRNTTSLSTASLHRIVQRWGGATVVAIAFGGACSKHDDKEMVAPKSKIQEFTCLKVSGGPGVGRECIGPGYSFTKRSADDVYSAQEAWCLTQRVSWTNPHSVMRCAATEQECNEVLAIAPNGKQTIFMRTPCTRTRAEAWTPNEAEYSIHDAFVCTPRPDYSSKVKGATMDTCMASIAETIERTKDQVVEQAWCFEGSDKGSMFNMRCYRDPLVCAREAVELGASTESCALTDVQKALDAFYGSLDKR